MSTKKPFYGKRDVLGQKGNVTGLILPFVLRQGGHAIAGQGIY